MAYKIIGHRGNKTDYLENTLEGFDSILNMDGVDGFELDIVVSKDKQLLISHDMVIKSPFNNKLFIHDLTYNELLTLNKVSYKQRDKKGERYPLLEDVFKLYANVHSNKNILLEIKSLPSESVYPLSIPQLIKNIHLLLAKYNLMTQCTIISFDYRIISESYKQNKKVKVGLILHNNLLPLKYIVENLHLTLLVMSSMWITQEQVLEMSQRNIAIYAWTPNEEKEWIRLNQLGIQGMITDKPEELNLFHKKANK